MEEDLRQPHVLVVIAGGEGAMQVAHLLVNALETSGRASHAVEIGQFDVALDTQLAMVVVVAECDAEGLSAPTRRWLRHGRAELLAARRCDVVTVAVSACSNSAASLKPCAISAAHKIGVRLRSGGAAVDETALYVDVGVDTNVEEALSSYVRRLALGWPTPTTSPELQPTDEAHLPDLAEWGAQAAAHAAGDGRCGRAATCEAEHARLDTALTLGLRVAVPAVALMVGLAAVTVRRLLSRRV